MKISKSGKIVLAILTVGQLFVMLFALIWFFTTLFPAIVHGNDEAIQNLLILSLVKFLVFGIVMSILSFGLQIFYIIHAGTNKATSTTMKIVWICLLFFIGFIVEVVYFFMEILPDKSMTGHLEERQSTYGAS